MKKDPSFNGLDLAFAIGLAVLVVVWFIIYAVLLMQYGVFGG